MYALTTRSARAGKQFYEALQVRPAIQRKLELLKDDPRRNLNAHKLRGRLEGKWSCYLGWDLRMIYEIDEVNKEIVVVAVGTHKVYG